MLTGTNLKYARAHNLRIVLEIVRLFGPLPRKEIALRTGLKLQTVSNITRNLIESGLILEADRLQEGRGAPTTLLTLNPKGAYSIGLDFDREHFTGVLVDFLGKVCQRVSQPVHFPMPEEALTMMDEAVQTLIRRQDIEPSRLWGVGLGLPGPLGVASGLEGIRVVNASEFPGWTNVPIADILGKRLKLPIFIENNASAAAVGERWYGRGQHLENFFYLFFGVGLGGGLIVNGRPYEGHFGNAGEIWGVPTATGSTASPGIIKPHLGVFFSLPRLSEHLARLGIVISHPEELGALFERREPAFMAWLEEGLAQLAPFILTVEAMLDPQAIFLGGRYPEALTDYMKTRLETMLPLLRIEGMMTNPALHCGTAGQDATALGVATLPMYSSFAPIPEVLMKHAAGDTAPSPRL
ncbi:MAG: ROK family transcriptional regulator [Rhodothermales bacterium]|nr:ROK family transcriptional regulator [Rhodothermales bacterium]